MRLILALLLAALPAGATQVFVDDVAGWEAALPGPYGVAEFEANSGCTTGEVVTDGAFSVHDPGLDPNAICVKSEWSIESLVGDEGSLVGNTVGRAYPMTFGAPIWGALFDATTQDDMAAFGLDAENRNHISGGEPSPTRRTYGFVFDQPVDAIFFIASDGQYAIHSIRWKPVPEPSTGLLLALGLLLLAKRR